MKVSKIKVVPFEFSGETFNIENEKKKLDDFLKDEISEETNLKKVSAFSLFLSFCLLNQYLKIRRNGMKS